MVRERPRQGSWTVLFVMGLLTLSGCVVVPRYARGTVSDPAMASAEGMLSRSLRKLRNSREGAAGGDGAAAGGGCGCGQ